MKSALHTAQLIWSVCVHSWQSDQKTSVQPREEAAGLLHLQTGRKRAEGEDLAPAAARNAPLPGNRYHMCIICGRTLWIAGLKRGSGDMVLFLWLLRFVIMCLYASLLQRWNLLGCVTCQRRSCCVSSNIPAWCRNSSSTPRTNTLLSTTSSRETNRWTTLSSFCR